MTVREQAILICAIAASTPDLSQAYGAVASELEIRPNFYGRTSAEILALAAWGACKCAEHPDAEAEALLQTGWTP